MKSQIELESVKTELNAIKKLMIVNDIPADNIPSVVLYAIKLAGIAIESKDAKKIFNLKKSL